ncbi:MAG: hypothetical protein R3293_13740 [Candidatus Promineifilaceae bacterium]|nr:hypothetical protein [Candidatus Promineifilaceae bacterium]
MKHAVSVSLGSSDRDKTVELELFGETIVIERRGVDGDIDKATALFTELDGQVDALGVGGIDLWVQMGEHRYPLRAALKMVKNVQETPIVDGTGLKMTLERHAASALVEALGPEYATGRVLHTAAVDRYGLTLGFNDLGYEMVCGDLMFALGIPIPVRSMRGIYILGRLLIPIVGYLPISVLYPTGEKQDEIVPKFTKYYEWATVIAGDCHYIKHHMPDDLRGKVIVTNTTTVTDMELFRERGIQHVMTTTPILNGRSFGTNMLEAAITAAAGKKRPLTFAELEEMLQKLDLKPTLHSLEAEQL